ncbi:hypothetical protein F5Y11DRAFT_347061 [Daldinia sp. FL1419]|nr:hypothetical protein F5Y11DRAFT_347061 [Daldinia sp. FL1419]
MADFYDSAQAAAIANVTDRPVYTIQSERVDPGSTDVPDFLREDNLRRAYALECLQFCRDNIVERQVLYTTLWDLIQTYSAEFRELVSLCVGFPRGIFHERHTTEASLLKYVGKNRDAFGNPLSYKGFFNRTRRSLYSFWIMPIDGVWVMIVMHIVNPLQNDSMMIERYDGMRLNACVIKVYDVVEEGRLERRQRIEERLPFILDQGDIDTINLPGRPHAAVEGIPFIPFSQAKQAGILIHLLAESLFDRLEMIVQRNKNPLIGTIHQRLHNRYELSLWDQIRFPGDVGSIARARGRMIGHLMTGMSFSNGWRVTAAFEVIPYQPPHQNGLSGAYNQGKVHDDVQRDGNENYF